jgi:hypothetical protein
LKSGSKNYGLIIVGSDQVWTPLGLYSKFFNLLFVDDSIPRMSYASSFGGFKDTKLANKDYLQIP